MRGLRFLRRSLAARLALVYGLTSVVTIGALGLAVYFLTARYSYGQVENDLENLADFYSAYTATTAPDEARLRTLAPSIVGFFAPQSQHTVRLYDAGNGALLSGTHDIGPLPSSVALAELSYRQPTLFLARSSDRSDRLYASRSVAAADGAPLAVVEVSRDVGEVRSFLATLRLVLAGAAGLALAAGLVASLALARRMTRPLRQIEAATHSIADGDFSRRLISDSGDEISRLATSINRMAEDLGRLEVARREFIAKISHDLRTPLTAIKGFVVNLQDEAPDEMRVSLTTMDEQTDRLIRLVDDLLVLSRLQRGQVRLQRSQTDLAAVARSALAVLSEKARRLNVALTSDLPAALPPVNGDADRIQQVIINLLDNGLKATPSGGTVRVRAVAKDDAVTLTVADTGRGPMEEEVARAFEPYFRGPGGGAGLGLTIAREIVVAHGGRIWLSTQPEGGAEAGFVLPCSSGTRMNPNAADE